MSLTTNVNRLTCHGSEHLTIGDIADIQDYEIPECIQQNVSKKHAIKEIYKWLKYLHKQEPANSEESERYHTSIDYEPCPICLFGTIRSKRTCRYCGTISCPTCCENRWHTMQIQSKGYKWNHSIENKRCNICHTRCTLCRQLYPRSENHECK